LIEPGKFALDLQGEFTRRRDDQGKGRGSPIEPLGATKKILRNGQPVRDGFARAGLGGHKKVAVDSRFRKHRGLDSRRLIVVARL
jgi:hypothetical protein